MAQLLKSIAALAENKSSGPSTHSEPITQLWGGLMLSSGLCRQVCTYILETHAHAYARTNDCMHVHT